MKLYKFILPTLLLGSTIGLVSCSNEEDDIFDKSAAQRLDEYKVMYSADLTAEGGKWLMEYFANEDEYGYVFIMTFNKDGSVKISGQNTWMDHQYKSDVSLWQIIADNGPVLSFNTYNSVFHEFSTPENITGPDAPTNPDNNNEDIDEQGTGHGGDYEFVIIGLSEDGKTMHLTGKKRLYDIYMHRLDPSVDEASLLAEYDFASQRFDSRFSELSLWDKVNNEEFIIKNINTGIISAYPLAGDAITQTSTGNAILYQDGFRLMRPLEIERADNSESVSVQTFKLSEDGTLACVDNPDFFIRSRALSYEFTNKTKKWRIDLDNVSGAFQECIENLKAGFINAYKNKRNLRAVEFAWEVYNTENTPFLNIQAGSTYSHYYLSYETKSDTEVALKYIDAKDNNGTRFLKDVDAVQQFLDFISTLELEFSAENPLYPTRVKCTSKANGNDYFYITLV